MAVGNNGVGVFGVIPDASNKGVGVRDITMNGRGGCIRAYYEFPLEAES
jgi:hypothetical protein